VVRKHGSGKIHVVDAPPGTFGRYKWIGPWFTGIALPVVTVCGVELRGKDSVAVCMEAYTRIGCSPCRRLSQMDRAGDDNGALPEGHPLQGVPDPPDRPRPPGMGKAR
jgi:hypothetical protein